MGFGGSASAMNAIIKNNRNMLKRKKREKFKSERSDFKISQNYQYKKASRQQILELRQKLRNENKKNQQRFYVVFGFMMVCIISFMIYFFIT